MGRYRISQLAERVGVPATTLRYYAAEGLFPTRRTPNGYRTYDDQDVGDPVVDPEPGAPDDLPHRSTPRTRSPLVEDRLDVGGGRALGAVSRVATTRWRPPGSCGWRWPPR